VRELRDHHRRALDRFGRTVGAPSGPLGMPRAVAGVEERCDRQAPAVSVLCANASGGSTSLVSNQPSLAGGRLGVMEPAEDELREFFNLVGEHKLVKRFIALRQVLDAARLVVDDPQSSKPSWTPGHDRQLRPRSRTKLTWHGTCVEAATVGGRDLRSA
jgi:hypothetical protein